MMIEIPGVLSAEDLRQCRAELDKANWQDGRQTAGHTAARAKANQQLSQDDPLSEKLGNFVLDRLGASKLFIAAALPLKVLPPRFNRYTGSGSYGDHIDNAVFSVPGTGHRIRGDLSATLFFSEPGEYDGGELVVQGEFENRQVKLPAGHMILYPASSLHRVTPVTRGARIASFFWIQSMVRENGRRSMLLELDETIRVLAAETPDHPAIVRLTGLYHNLLRGWAET